MIYFDNAATTFPKPETVYKAVDNCSRNYAVNVGRGQYELSDFATIVVEKTRKKLLEFFNASFSNVIFSPSATIALNQILRGLDYSKIKNVYISPFEHNAVIRTLNYLQKEYNFNLYIMKVNLNPFKFDLEYIDSQFKVNPPDLLVVSHASNVCGAVVPVEKIFEMAKNYEAITILDTAQTAGIIDIYYNDWFIDFLVFAGHKGLLGPFGIAGFIIKNNNVMLTPIISGGSGHNSIEPLMPDELPYKYEAGSLNINAIAGLNASLDFFKSEEYKKIKGNDFKILREFEILLNDFGEFSIYGNAYQGQRVPVISINHEDYSPDELGIILNKYDIAVRTGLHCSPLVHKFFSTLPAGSVRFSFGLFNTSSELNSLKMIMEGL